MRSIKRNKQSATSPHLSRQNLASLLEGYWIARALTEIEASQCNSTTYEIFEDIRNLREQPENVMSKFLSSNAAKRIGRYDDSLRAYFRHKLFSFI